MSPDLAQQLADLGGTALFVITVALAAIGLLRGWWVPGWVYTQLREDWAMMRDQGDRNAKALEQLLALNNHDRGARRGS